MNISTGISTGWCVRSTRNGEWWIDYWDNLLRVQWTRNKSGRIFFSTKQHAVHAMTSPGVDASFCKVIHVKKRDPFIDRLARYIVNNEQTFNKHPDRAYFLVRNQIGVELRRIGRD